MAILLMVVVVVALIAFGIRTLKSYEAELRQNPGTPGDGKATDGFLFEASEAGSPHSASAGHSSHQGDPGCAGSHHGGCDIGVHSGFDAGHGGFDGGGHH
jgi:hypothetical protein